MSVNTNPSYMGGASRGGTPVIRPVEPPRAEVETVVHKTMTAPPADGVDQTRAAAPAAPERAAGPNPSAPKDDHGRNDPKTKEAMVELSKHNTLELQRMLRYGLRLRSGLRLRGGLWL